MGRLITIGGVAPVVHGSRSSTRSPCKCPNWWNWKTASAHSHPDGSHTNPLALVDGFVLEDLRLCSAWVCWSGSRNRDRGRVPALGTVPPASLVQRPRARRLSCSPSLRAPWSIIRPRHARLCAMGVRHSHTVGVHPICACIRCSRSHTALRMPRRAADRAPSRSQQ